MGRILSHCTVVPDLNRITHAIASEGQIDVVGIVLPYLSVEQRDDMLYGIVCGLVHNEEAVALLLPVCDVPKCLRAPKPPPRFFYTPNPAAIQQVNDWLLNQKFTPS